MFTDPHVTASGRPFQAEDEQPSALEAKFRWRSASRVSPVLSRMADSVSRPFRSWHHRAEIPDLPHSNLVVSLRQGDLCQDQARPGKPGVQIGRTVQPEVGSLQVAQLPLTASNIQIDNRMIAKNLVGFMSVFEGFLPLAVLHFHNCDVVARRCVEPVVFDCFPPSLHSGLALTIQERFSSQSYTTSGGPGVKSCQR